MTGSSVLPVTIHKGKLYFLFGKENPMEDSAKGYSDFGGGVEKRESLYDTAMREGGEELTGFLGDGSVLKKYIKKHGGTYKICHNDYHVHLFYREYDPNLPFYYNQNHQFLWNRIDKQFLNKTKLFEKIKIKWFDVNTIKNKIREFRPFYQHVVKAILLHEKNIKKFVKKCRKTQKQKSKKNYTRKFRSL
jgi:8-oxo-dGTP pyrophosphatase MutT (NUDIX family)